MSKTNEPPMWGKYDSKAAWLASNEHRAQALASLESHRVMLASAKRIHDAEAIDFYSKQVRSFELSLGLAPAQAKQTQAQQSLFDSLLK